MTNEEMIQDLKQFIAAIVSQSEERINNNLGGRLDTVEHRLTRVESRLSNLDTKFDAIQEAIATLSLSQMSQLMPRFRTMSNVFVD